MRERRTVAGWRGGAVDLKLSADDVGLLDNVITVIPILRVVAALGQEARRRGLRYPVATVGELQACIAKDRLRYGAHRINAETISHAMPESWFPIAHEGELLSRAHLALIRCEMEAAQLAPRPLFQRP